jgi:two-component system, OmpR family, sensor kinase
MNNSIKRFLLIYILLSVIFIYGLISLVSYTVSKSELDELYDANLQQVASAITAQHIAIKDITRLYDKSQSGHDSKIDREEEFYVRVLNKDNKILYVSHPNASVPFPSKLGLSTQKYLNKEWRFFSVNANQETIQVAQSLELRKETIADMALSLMASQLLFIPILVILILFAIKKALRPLAALSTAIQLRQSLELQPFPQDRIPAEIKPLVNALNLFMDRVSEMIEVIRRFTSDAAHELRTPITALKLQLTLVEQAKNKSEREQAISNLKSGIDRSEQLVSQLLILARIEPNTQVRKLEFFDLLSLVKESIGELLPLALVKNIDLGLTTSHSARINAVRHEIKILINNIIDNSIRYTPSNGQVDISILLNNQHIVLIVNDSGPGISQSDMDHVFERFYRGQNKDSKGSGLGLSIVHEIANQHNAKIEINNLHPGLSIRVYFLL